MSALEANQNLEFHKLEQMAAPPSNNHLINQTMSKPYHGSEGAQAQKVPDQYVGWQMLIEYSPVHNTSAEAELAGASAIFLCIKSLLHPHMKTLQVNSNRDYNREY